MLELYQSVNQNEILGKPAFRAPSHLSHTDNFIYGPRVSTIGWNHTMSALLAYKQSQSVTTYIS